MCIVKPFFPKYAQMHHGVTYMGVEIGYIHRHVFQSERFFHVKVRKPDGSYFHRNSLSLREIKAYLTLSVMSWYQGQKPEFGLAPEDMPRRILYDPRIREKMHAEAIARMNE